MNDHLPNTTASPPLDHQGGWVWFFARFRRHSGELARLAGPVIMSRAGILTLAVVDTMMLGPLGAEQVAYYGFGTSTFVVLLVFAIGLLFGTVVETSHLRGEGRIAETGHVWRYALPYAILLGLIGIALTQFAEPYFLLVGQSDDLAKHAASVTAIQGLGLLPMMVYVISNFYLESMERPLPGMVAIWSANILNIILNFILIDPSYGWSGSEGVAIATTIARTAMTIGLVGYLLYLGTREPWGIFEKLPHGGLLGWLKGGAPMRRHGYAAGVAYVCESGAYHVMHIFAGWMATLQLAAFTINMNLFAMIFMASLGVANATAVRVGVAHGRKDWADRTLAGWTGVFWVAVILSPLTLALLLSPGPIMSVIYGIDDAQLLAVVALSASIAAFAIIVDGGQFTIANALRASNDAFVPTVLNFIGFIIVMIPVAYLFGVAWERGARGLFEAILVASTVTFLILTLRWVWLTSRTIPEPADVPNA